MNYFSNITSLAALKKQYRTLAITNHPDKGGDTNVMQAINTEFETLFTIWKSDTTAETTASGYESDYTGASAQEYSEYVYNEYRWKGSNYKGQGPEQVVEFIRKWIKQAYPRCTFSVTRKHYNSIYICLVKADFDAFIPESEHKCSKQLNPFYVERDKDLTQRAREVMKNVCSYANSYNYNNSDVMRDYFDQNFYLHIEIGNYDKPFKVETPKLTCRKGDEQPVFKHPEGAAHKAIRQALGNARFGFYECRSLGKASVLGCDAFGDNGEHYFWPKSYTGAKIAQKRMDKLAAVGIQCKLSGIMYIQFLGHTPETERKLEQERNEYAAAYKEWTTKNPNTIVDEQARNSGRRQVDIATTKS